MAVIAVKVDSIPGECTLAGFTDQIDAVSLREAIEVSVPQSAGTSASSGGRGRARHADIELTRYKDRASPKFSQACAAGDNLGTVKINLFRALETGIVVYLTYELTETFVSRIEHDTLDSTGAAFQPHLVITQQNRPSPPSTAGLAAVATASLQGQILTTRVAGRPVYAVPRGPAANRDVERLWLSTEQITWTYTPYINGIKQGVTSKSFNIRTSLQL